MARTRAQRRRQNALLLVALAVTVVVLGFARDVSRAAHDSGGVRRGEDRSFASLANDVIAGENQVDFHLGYLLQHGATLSRQTFGARLEQLARQLPPLTAQAQLLRRPTILGGLNVRVDLVLEQRVDDYQAIVDAVAARLSLPWQPQSHTAITATQAVASLQSLDGQLATEASLLLTAPGTARLLATTTSSGVADLSTELGTLSSAPSLRLTRSVALSAVQVTPSPLPAPTGEILLPPVTSVRLGIVATNLAWADQPVTLTLSFTSSTGLAQQQAFKVTLGPTRSFAFVARSLGVVAGERGTLRLTLRPAGGPPGSTVVRSYHLVVASSGLG